MKHITLLISFLFISFLAISQNKLSSKTIDIFYKAANLNYSYNLNGFKVMVNGYYIRRGYEFSDAALAVERIKEDSVSREDIIQSMSNLFIDKNRFFNYLYELGMTAISAKELSEYAISRYGIKNR